MIGVNKAQFSVIEIGFVLLLLFTFMIHIKPFGFEFQDDKKILVDSYLHSLKFNSTIRDLVLNENLSNSSLSQNWSQVDIYLGESFLSYSLNVGNSTTTKSIISCSGAYGKYVSEDIIATDSSNNYDFRKISLGVCY